MPRSRSAFRDCRAYPVTTSATLWAIFEGGSTRPTSGPRAILSACQSQCRPACAHFANPPSSLRHMQAARCLIAAAIDSSTLGSPPQPWRLAADISLRVEIGCSFERRRGANQRHTKRYPSQQRVVDPTDSLGTSHHTCSLTVRQPARCLSRYYCPTNFVPRLRSAFMIGRTATS